jgi:hypothetical protein
VFASRAGQRLGRAGVAYILARCMLRCPEPSGQRPH